MLKRLWGVAQPETLTLSWVRRAPFELVRELRRRFTPHIVNSYSGGVEEV